MKALVLSSGGVDSTTCLGLAVDQYGSENVIALAITYVSVIQKKSKPQKRWRLIIMWRCCTWIDTDFPVQRLFTSQSF